MKNFKVGERVMWNGKISKVECEYRGSYYGDDGKMACVIMNPTTSPDQICVKFCELEPMAKS